MPLRRLRIDYRSRPLHERDCPRDPMVLAPAFARELRQINPDVVASQVRPLEAYLRDSVAPRRFSVLLMGAFAMAAVVLALTGIYAVIMYSVSQRAREIGIRIALGASRSNIVRLVMGEGARLIVIGLLLGTALAAGLMRLLSSMLFGLNRNDAATFGQVLVAVTIAALVACALPSIRALKFGSRGVNSE